MPWNLSGKFFDEVLCRLDWSCFLVVAGTGVGPGSQEVSWMTLTVQFILMTSNFLHDGNLRMAGPGMSATCQQEFIWWGCAQGEPGCQVTSP